MAGLSEVGGWPAAADCRRCAVGHLAAGHHKPGRASTRAGMEPSRALTLPMLMSNTSCIYFAPPQVAQKSTFFQNPSFFGVDLTPLHGPATAGYFGQVGGVGLRCVALQSATCWCPSACPFLSLSSQAPHPLLTGSSPAPPKLLTRSSPAPHPLLPSYCHTGGCGPDPSQRAGVQLRDQDL